MSSVVTLSGVDEYLSTSLEGVQWAEKAVAEREKAVVSAGRTLSPFASGLSGTAFLGAVAEQAAWMLCNPYADQQLSGLSSVNITGIGYGFDTKTRPVHIAPKAWQILKANQVSTSTGGPRRTGRVY